MQSASQRLKVIVRDTGVGIPAPDLDKIFHMYSRLDENRKVQVCGLGLSISSALVQKLGNCHISVTSKPGKGSTFSFEVDISENDEDSLMITEGEESETEEADYPICVMLPRSFSTPHDFDTPHRYPEILIVDDVPFNRKVVRSMLEHGGYLCEEAGTGLQALRVVQKRQLQGRPFRVVLMDVDMPEMDGLAATRAIREDPEMMDFPAIIGCSAYCSEADRDLGLEAGMSAYLFKPLVKADLLRIVGTAF